MEWNFYPKDNLNYQKRLSHFETASFAKIRNFIEIQSSTIRITF